MELGDLLTCYSLIHPGISSVVFPYSFCHLILLSRVICSETFHLYVASSFFCRPIFCPRLVLCLIPLQSLLCFIICPSVSCCFPHIYFLSSSVFLLVSVASLAQFSQPYNKAGRAGVLHNFVRVFFRVCCGFQHTVYNAHYFQVVFLVIHVHFFQIQTSNF